jgi:hypothetical protein
VSRPRHLQPVAGCYRMPIQFFEAYYSSDSESENFKNKE